MPKTRWNVDHQTQIVDGIPTQPGEPREFDDDEQVAGLWSETDPRAGLAAERRWKKTRDSQGAPEPQPGAESPTPDEPAQPAKEE